MFMLRRSDKLFIFAFLVTFFGVVGWFFLKDHGGVGSPAVVTCHGFPVGRVFGYGVTSLMLVMVSVVCGWREPIMGASQTFPICWFNGGWVGIQQRLKRDAKASASFPFSHVPHHQSVVSFGEFFHVHVKYGSSELIFCQS